MDPVQMLVSHFSLLLLFYWGLSTFASTVALIPLPFATSFRSAVLLSACRGKLMDFAPQRALGVLSLLLAQDWTVPQAWFAHFYAIGAAWNLVAAAIFCTSFLPSLDSRGQATHLLLLLLLEVHLVRRLVETTHLLRYPPGARMHGIAYLFGLSYYLLVPLTVLPEGSHAAMAGAVGRVKDAGVTGLSQLLLPTSLLLGEAPLRDWATALTPLQWLGVAVFLGGNLLQGHSHWLLARLSSKAGGRPAYRIPHVTGVLRGWRAGGGFTLVSCPHYLGEVVIYAGLLLSGGGRRVLLWLMLCWVLSNLVLAGGMTHRWYRRHFKAYPRTRRAIIPFIY